VFASDGSRGGLERGRPRPDAQSRHATHQGGSGELRDPGCLADVASGLGEKGLEVLPLHLRVRRQASARADQIFQPAHRRGGRPTAPLPPPPPPPVPTTSGTGVRPTREVGDGCS
jgi:hypothetical protein